MFDLYLFVLSEASTRSRIYSLHSKIIAFCFCCIGPASKRQHSYIRNIRLLYPHSTATQGIGDNNDQSVKIYFYISKIEMCLSEDFIYVFIHRREHALETLSVFISSFASSSSSF